MCRVPRCLGGFPGMALAGIRSTAARYSRECIFKGDLRVASRTSTKTKRPRSLGGPGPLMVTER